MAGIDSYAKLVLHMDGSDGSTTFTDSGTTGHTVTAVGNAQIDTAQSVFGGASGLYDGTGDYCTVPDHADWDFGTGEWTVDFRVRIDDAGTTNQGVFTNEADATGYDTGITINVTNLSGTRLEVYIVNTQYVESWSPTSDTWYHVAVLRSGNNLMMFIDGTQIGSSDDITGKDIQVSAGVRVGWASDNYSSLGGWLDEFRVSKGIARWTANFTPPTAAYSADGPAGIKTVNGLAIGSVKTIKGLATASVSKWNGVT